MLKKMLLTAVVFALSGAAGLYSQTLEVSGEMKTGLYWRRAEAPDSFFEEARMHNMDDAGEREGRFRMNLHMKMNTIGMKVRFEQTTWSSTQPNQWAFAFAYGDFFNEQLRIVAGRLGESPWAAGGPDIWQELDNRVGIRTEVKPAILPGLNAGFVINGYNQTAYNEGKGTLADILQETVFGASYTHEYFHARFCWRLDGEADRMDKVQDGMEMMYRLEERIFQKYVEGLQLWMNGWWRGIGTENEDQDLVTRIYYNWFYAQWEHQLFTAQLRLGYHPAVKVNELHTRISFYYNILSWLSAGAAFYFQVDTGDTPVKDVPYKKWIIEPTIKATFAPGTYVAFVYQFENEPESVSTNKQTNRINLRSVFTF